MIMPNYLVKREPNHPVVVKIKEYDRALYFMWNNKKNRWELWRKGKNRLARVTRIQNQDKSYRHVDERLFKFLVYNDLWQYKNATEVDREIAEYERNEDAIIQKDIYSDLVARSKYARKAFARCEG